MSIYYYSFNQETSKSINCPKPFNSFLKTLKIVQNIDEFLANLHLSKAKRSCFVFSCHSTDKNSLLYLRELISQLRSSSIIINILVCLEPSCLHHAKNYLAAGACRVIPLTFEPKTLKTEIHSLLTFPVQARNWLRAFQLDNVLQRNYLPSIKELLSYKLNRRFSSLIYHQKSCLTQSPLSLLSERSNPNYITKEDVLLIIEKCIKKPLNQLPKSKIAATKKLKHSNSNAFELVTENQSILTGCKNKKSPILLTNQVNDILNLPHHFLLKNITCLIILVSENISLEQLNSVYSIGVFDVIKNTSQHIFKALQLAYLHKLWPYYAHHINLSTLNYAHRIIFFNDLFLRKKQSHSQLSSMDIYCLFPEFFMLNQ